MSVSEKVNEQTRKWDKENMCSFSCRVRSYEAEVFREYCTANGTTPYKVLKNSIMRCNDEYSRKLKIRKDD
ncbi:MAG: hypothetical protein NC253_00945 [Ruminococcus sp.]|nr:hypothetical protein [Ruminococcus sp.]MCM1478986.1 hypothetical protein [Muribaculaceae bacterium]